MAENQTPVETPATARSSGTLIEDTKQNESLGTSASGEKDAAKEASPEDHYPHGMKMFVLMAGLGLSVFCVGLDNTIIATAIPVITDHFHSIGDVGWYGSAYYMTTCAFQLLFGKLYNLFDIKLVYLVSLFIFEVGSLLCALAPSSDTLIGGRALAGLGACGLFIGALIIVTVSTPLAKRPIYTAIAGFLYGIGTIVGPIIGGAFATKVTWRWCFYINLPLGGVTAFLILIFLRLPPHPKAGLREKGILRLLWSLDPVGTLFLVASIVCLLLALQFAGSSSIDSGRCIALFVVFAVSLIVFAGIQIWMGEQATIPLRIMKQRTIAFASLFGLFLGGAYSAAVYFIPLWFQAIRGVSAYRSGIDNIPLIIFFTVAITFSGAMTTKFGYYMPYVIGSVIFTSVGAGLISTWSPSTNEGKWIGYQIIFGIGCGLAFQTPQIAAQTVLSIADVSIGVSITFLSEVLGGTVFISACDYILNHNLVKRFDALDIPNFNSSNVIELGATEFRNYVPSEYLPEAIEAYSQSLTRVFYVIVILSCLTTLGAAGMEWRSVHQAVMTETAKSDPEAASANSVENADNKEKVDAESQT